MTGPAPAVASVFCLGERGKGREHSPFFLFMVLPTSGTQPFHSHPLANLHPEAAAWAAGDAVELRSQLPGGILLCD